MKLACIFLLVSFALFGAVQGTVSGPDGKPLPGVRVEIYAPSGQILFAGETNAEGRFEWGASRAGAGQVRLSKPGFTSREFVQDLSQPLELKLEAAAVHTQVSVTATRGGVEEAASSPHVTAVLDREAIEKRHLITVGNILENLPGILVQQTGTAQVSPFLRGLTGYQVLNLMDGIRFNNSTFRSGPNQYLAFVEPSQAQRVEAILGPTGVQYGSDSLGGSIQVTSEAPRFGQTHATLSFGGATADLSGMAAARVSTGTERVFWLIGASGRAHNDLRAGRGLDERNVYTRFFGLSPAAARDLIGSRQQDTGFQQYGLETKLALRPRDNQLVTLNFQRGEQFNSRNYKDLNGGLGRQISDFSPQVLNWFYGRYELLDKGWLDSLSTTFSFNQQTDGTRRQNLLDRDPITNDLARVNVYGYTAQGTRHLGTRGQLSFGGDFYDEYIASTRDVFNPVTNVTTRPRPLYPDGSRYGNLGFFTQASWQLHRRLRAAGGLRHTAIRFADRTNTLWFRDTTYNASLRFDATSWLGLHGVASRGFRAPNLNDLGALGLNDLGYEIPASEAIPAGALLATSAGENALSKNERLRALKAESLMNYEFGVTLRNRKLESRLQGFHADLTDPIVRRTLLFPASSPPTSLAGLPVTVIPPTADQRNQGVVTVATNVDPRAVKAFVNDGASRYYGLEGQMLYRLTSRLSIDGNYSFIVGRDLNPNRNIRRLPPQMGAVMVRHTPSGRRPWMEVTLAAQGRQSRLSGGDIDDERIGASRRRQDIASFFNSTMAAQFIDPVSRTFRPTNETLLQIQNRVLPGLADGVRVPLYLSTKPWATLSFRSGYALTDRWRVMGALENLLDQNYRLHGSGMDSPGFNAYLNLSYRF